MFQDNMVYASRLHLKFIFIFEKGKNMTWGDSSTVKSTKFSYTEHRFNSQHTQGSSLLPGSPTLGDLMHNSDFCRTLHAPVKFIYTGTNIINKQMNKQINNLEERLGKCTS